MKAKMTTCLLLLFFVVISINAQQASSRILGTWKLVSYKYGDKETKFATDSIQRIKLITQTYFTWVHYMAKDGIVRSSAGGRYVLDGDTYIEYIDFGLGMDTFLGKQHSFKIKFDNDKMYISGELANSLKIEEVWSKIESK